MKTELTAEQTARLRKRMVALAPEMVDALREIVESLEAAGIPSTVYSRARSILNRLDGEG